MIRPSTKNDRAHARSCDPTSRDRALTLTLLLAPALAALGWDALAPSTGPASALANTVQFETPPTPPPRLRAATDEETLALAYCAEICERLDEIDAPTLLPGLPEAPMLDPEEGDDPLTAPGISIASILRDAQGRPAVYADGALYVVGDTVADGWVIESIDLPTRTLVVRHPRQDEPITLSPGR